MTLESTSPDTTSPSTTSPNTPSPDTRTVDARLPTSPARRGRPSRRWGRLRILSSLLAVLVVAAGVVLIRDAAVALGIAGGSMWTADALAWMDGATRDATWLWPAAILGVLLGLWFLTWALTAPKQSLVPVPGHPGIYVRTSGIGRIAVHAARDVPGVDDCSAQASAGRVKVSTRTTGGAGIKDEVTKAVQDALGPLSDRCSVRVNVKGLHE